MDYVIGVAVEQDHAAAQDHAQQQADGGVLHIVGGDTSMRRDRIVHDLHRAVGDNIGDLVRQDHRDGVCQVACLFRVTGANRDLEKARGVHSLRGNHFPQLLIGIIRSTFLKDQLHIGAGLQDRHVGIHQIGGRTQLARADSYGTGQREGAVVDIEESVCFILRGNKHLRVDKRCCSEISFTLITTPSIS